MYTVAQKAQAELELRRRRKQSTTPTWRDLARPEQLPPPGDWRVWLCIAGRGWGKTRTGAEWLRSLKATHGRMAIIAPTYADARDTCMEGESGLKTICTKDEIATWNRSLGELVFDTGARVKLFSADEPERLRGPQHHAIWMDEVGAWAYSQQAYDQAMFGLRLGTHPQACVTTTPRPIPLLKDLLKQSTTVVVRGSTYDNKANLAPAFLEQIVQRYEGTRLGQQELHAMLLDDTPGALWTRAILEATRVSSYPKLVRVVVGIDPAASSDEGANETGIIVAGKGIDGHGYVLGDYTIAGTPAQWAHAAIAAYHLHQADKIIAERNNGGEMVEHTLRSVKDNAHIPVETVWASRGKQTRAEPISALYEQGKFHHVGLFAALEDQQCSWLPGMDSPDRMDALVWSASALFPNLAAGPFTAAAGGSRPAIAGFKAR